MELIDDWDRLSNTVVNEVEARSTVYIYKSLLLVISRKWKNKK